MILHTFISNQNIIQEVSSEILFPFISIYFIYLQHALKKTNIHKIYILETIQIRNNQINKGKILSFQLKI